MLSSQLLRSSARPLLRQSRLYRPHTLPQPPANNARHASTTSAAASPVIRLRNAFYGTSIALVVAFAYLYVTDTRASVHKYVSVPLLRFIWPDAEDAHHASTHLLRSLYDVGIYPRERGAPDAAGDLRVEVFGQVLDNPIGTSAGIDKDATIPSALLALGPAIVEVGAATPYPQEGNPKPRVWRLPSQNALINRYGFNSEGAEFVAMRLRQRVREFAYSMGLGLDEEGERLVLNGEAGVPPGSLVPGKMLAVQIAKAKTTSETDLEGVRRDYVFCAEQLAKYADIIVVNVSSPNTPGLRSLQRVEPLTDLLTGVVDAVARVDRKTKPAVMVKVSPDEDSDEQIAGIAEAVWESGVDGVIVGNTTKKRPDPLPKGYALPAKETSLLLEQGGYSGPQMFDRTLSLVKRYRRVLDFGPRQTAVSTTSAPSPLGQDNSSNPGDEVDQSVAEKIEASQQRDGEHLKDPSSTESPPLIQVPERHSSSFSEASTPGTLTPPSTPTSSTSQKPLSQDEKISRRLSDKPKVIFATGGITNGKQALEVLNAGASVVQMYTAIIYGGLGTVTRVKEEMREEIKKGGR